MTAELVICRDPTRLPPLKSPVVVTIGNFDGVHLGHKALLARARDYLKDGEGTLVVISFYPHPGSVLRRAQPVPLLTTLKQKCDYLEEEGVSLLYALHFTEALAQLSAEEFLQGILVKTLKVDHLVIGPDARVGKNREGDVEFIKSVLSNHGKTVEVVSFTEEEGKKVSSGAIRDLVRAGDVEGAKRALGREFQLEGRVVPGQKRGRTIGFPTANISTKQLLPGIGVYATRFIMRGHLFQSVTNVGLRPTFGGIGVVPETFVFARFDREFYGEPVQVNFVKKIREEQVFADVNMLRAQIIKDVESAQRILKDGK